MTPSSVAGGGGGPPAGFGAAGTTTTRGNLLLGSTNLHDPHHSELDGPSAAARRVAASRSPHKGLLARARRGPPGTVFGDLGSLESIKKPWEDVEKLPSKKEKNHHRDQLRTPGVNVTLKGGGGQLM